MSDDRAPRLADTTERQRRASDPASSAWVSANAGSGKTHVLTQRVLRLLLAGARPSRILCLTFTKAAAANMSQRVFKALGKWTRLDDAKLTAAILETGETKVDAKRLAFARKLFARTIETPGGLKIQTIHAFCERVLHLFPFEANVAAGFRVAEDRDAALLMEEAQMRAFADADSRPELAAAIATVAELAGADGFDKLLDETLKQRELLAAFATADAYAAELAARLGVRADETVTSVESEMLEDGGGAAAWRSWAARLNEGSPNDKKLAGKLLALVATPDAEALLGAFFIKNGEGTPVASLVTKKISESYPDTAAALVDEQTRLDSLRDRRRAVLAIARSRSLFLVARATLARYAEAKTARGLLDFDDLIVRTLALLQRVDAAWVLFKLDRGIEHILVDEAQDTSPAQWAILGALAADFLSGESAEGANRTFFAVGDEKQSIFSFQGAAPAMFDEMRSDFRQRHERAQLGFAEVRLNLSFRSSSTVLEAVDAAFAADAVWRGVSSELTAPPHEAHHASRPGSVEIWPTIAPDEAPEPGEWKLPVDSPGARAPAVRLAARIAGVIAGWLSPASPERVIDAKEGTPRRIRAGDVLILVRSRGALFESITRALRRAGVPSAGADRLMIGEHIGVMDLVAAGRAALNADDDLSLAAVLKSPLLGLDDDALMPIAHGRAGSLASALAASGHKAAARVAEWRRRAATLSPFDFYACLLGADGGRRLLIARLGPEAADAIDEFLARALDFERRSAASLSAFLDEFSSAEIGIKRDMEAEADSVRVMTVHASKGLEAPIVFMPDTCGSPDGRHDPKWMPLPTVRPGAPPLSVWTRGAGDDSAAISAGRTAWRAAAAGEHRRLLYVAMTRAAERLIIAGFDGKRTRSAECWYELVQLGLGPKMSAAPAPWNPEESVLRFAAGEYAPTTATPEPEPSRAPEPDWLRSPALVESGSATLAPSRLASDGNFDPERRRRLERGRLVHALLQDLAEIEPGDRAVAARRGLERLAPTLLPDELDTLRASVLAVLDNPQLAPLFAPGSRAEVALGGVLTRDDGAELLVNGRVDRLAVTPEAIFLADFKSGARRHPAPSSYVSQLALYRETLAALYPGRATRAFLVWTDAGELEELPSTVIDAAISRLKQKA